MATYIALLRGINVGGKNKIRMAELRDALQGAGFDSVETYVQSGNVVLKSALRSAGRVQQEIETAIRTHWNIDVPTMVLTATTFRRILDEVPWDDTVPVAERCIAFTAKDISIRPDQIELPETQDECQLGHRAVYIRIRGGFAKTKLSNQYFERLLKMPCTSRNWKTTQALKEMLACPNSR